MQVIIFPQDNGGVLIITPAPEYADQIEAVAQKDVPAGKPWRIVDDSALPPRESRDRWVWTDDGPMLSPDNSDQNDLPVPRSISFAQLMIGLVSEGWITAADGRAWRDRVALPAQVQAVIASLPEGQQFAAETRALAPSEVLRNDPLVSALSAVAGKSSADLDAFFRKYAGV